jgi:FixJ family two-component response regulator
MPEEAKKTILCVDDEQDIIDSLYDTFMDTYNVKTALGGEDALKIFNEEDIAVVITDQRMPNMEGTELLARINEQKPICKKILLTGYADINAAIDAINKGSVDKYFSKPWDDDELLKAIEHLISMYDFDKFLQKMQEDGERIIGDMETGKDTVESFVKFLDTYFEGVCVVGQDNKIVFLNKEGLEIMQYNDVADIRGRDINDLFLVDKLKKDIHPVVVFDGSKFSATDDSYLKPKKISAKLSDGTKAVVEAKFMFDIDNKEGNAKLWGLIFSKPS